MWKPLATVLAPRFTVIAPDLPGIGDSSMPKSGLDMKTSAAARPRGAVRSLGHDKVRVVGHDIGLMVAYAYAADVSAGRREARADGCVPARRRRMGGDLQQSGDLAFPLLRPDAGGAGQGSRADSTSNTSGTTSPPTSATRFPKRTGAHTRRPTRAVRAEWRPGSRTSRRSRRPRRISRSSPRPDLTIPVLSIGGEKVARRGAGRAGEARRTDATVIVLKDTGHWIMEERPDETHGGARPVSLTT